MLEQLDESLLAAVREKGAYLRAEIEKMPGVREIRGMGLMLGVGLQDGLQAGAIVGTLLEQGLLCLTAGHNTIRMLPPLTISKAEIDTGLRILSGVLSEAAS